MLQGNISHACARASLTMSISLRLVFSSQQSMFTRGAKRNTDYEEADSCGQYPKFTMKFFLKLLSWRSLKGLGQT